MTMLEKTLLGATAITLVSTIAIVVNHNKIKKDLKEIKEMYDDALQLDEELIGALKDEIEDLEDDLESWEDMQDLLDHLDMTIEEAGEAIAEKAKAKKDAQELLGQLDEIKAGKEIKEEKKND